MHQISRETPALVEHYAWRRPLVLLNYMCISSHPNPDMWQLTELVRLPVTL